jgi:hypothetical protein
MFEEKSSCGPYNIKIYTPSGPDLSIYLSFFSVDEACNSFDPKNLIPDSIPPFPFCNCTVEKIGFSGLAKIPLHPPPPPVNPPSPFLRRIKYSANSRPVNLRSVVTPHACIYKGQDTEKGNDIKKLSTQHGK